MNPQTLTQEELQAKGQSGSCSTVKVKADNEHGFAVINESDFNAKVHEKFEEPAVEKKVDAKSKK